MTENTNTGNKCVVLFKFTDPAAGEIHSEEQIKFLKSICVKIEKSSFNKVPKKTSKDM